MLSQLSLRRVKLNEDSPLQTTEEYTRKDLAQQAKYVAELIVIMKKTNWSMYDRECYLISSDWFTKWAGYVGLPRYLNNIDTITDLKLKNAETNTIQSHPGPIDNEALIANTKGLLFHSQGNNKLVLRENLEENKDFYVLTKDIWNYLYFLYGGTAIQRDCIILGGNGRIKKDIKMLKVIFI